MFICLEFSTSVELESENVCVSVCVCPPKILVQPGDLKNGGIWLKFCTLGPWVNTWGCFFHFLKILIFGAWGRVFFSQNKLILAKKLLGQPGDFKNV